MNKIKYCLIITMTILISIITSCYYTAYDYVGDGALSDKGPTAATERYVLDLGAINLDKTNSQVYHMKNLPIRELTIGIEINVIPEDSIIRYKQPINAIVSIELFGPRDEPVIIAQSSLNTWTWEIPRDYNTAFIYREKIPDTYFTPIKNAQYNLKLTVVQPNSSNVKYTARLLMKSGGWK